MVKMMKSVLKFKNWCAFILCGLAVIFMFSCSNFRDTDCVEYGSLVFRSCSRNFDTGLIESADVSLHGNDFESMNKEISISKGKGTVVFDQIPVGVNRVVKVEAKRTIENVLSKMEGVEMYGMTNIEKGENPVEVNWATTAKAKIFYNLLKFYNTDISQIKDSFFNDYIPLDVHSLFVDSDKIAKDYKKGQLTTAADYYIEPSTVEFNIVGLDEEGFSAYVGDPVSEKIEVTNGKNIIENIPEGNWYFYITKGDSIYYSELLTVKRSQEYILDEFVISVPKPRFEDESGKVLTEAEFNKGETKTVFLSCRTLDEETPVEADIYYTLDGNEPDEKCEKYSSSGIEISDSVTLKAVAVKGGKKSEVSEIQFTAKEVVTDFIAVYVPKSLNYEYIHYFSCSNKTKYPSTTWPGVKMESEGNYYFKKFEDTTSVSLLIVNSSKAKLISEDIIISEPGEYIITKEGVTKKDETDSAVTVLVEKYFGNATMTFSSCSNSSYSNQTIKFEDVSKDGKDWIYTFKDTDSVTIDKITAGSQTYSKSQTVTSGVYRAGWEKADGGDDKWSNDSRIFTIMKTVVVTAYVEQKGNHQMYLAHYQHDDESQELCDLSRTAYWDSVPCGTELSERVGVKKNADGYWIRKFRVVEGKIWRIQPTLGGWGSEAYVSGSYKDHYSVSAAAVSGGSLKSRASEYDFTSATDGTDLDCTRAALLTYHTDMNTGVQTLRLVWHGTDKIKWGKKGESGKEYTAERDTINGKENGWYYDFKNLEPGKTYFYTLTSVDGSSGSVTKNFKAPADSTVEEFNFAVCGDSQSPEYQNGAKGTYVKDNMDLMMTKSPAFVVSIGDLNNDGNYPGSQWETMFFKGIVPRLYDKSTGYQIPFNAAPGNHDRINALFRDYLGMDDRYGSFVYGDVLFLTIDVEKEFSPGSAQYEWIENTLKNDTHKWKLIALHEGPYCYAPRHYSNYRVKKYLCPLFEEYGVSVVFSGHIHCYNHPTPKNGIEYINLPCMASSPAVVSNEAPCLGENDFEGEGSKDGVYKAGEQGFGMVRVTKTALYIDIMNSKGTMLDNQIVVSAK